MTFLHYLGNRFLSLPNTSGQMCPDNTWLNEQFSIIQFNHQEPYKRCIEPFELYSPEQLHEHLQQTIESMDAQGIHYYLTYGFYNPSLSQYVFRNALGQPKNYFRVLGYEECAFGIGLDQLYFTSKFSIPDHLNTTIIPATEVLKERRLQPQEALREYHALLSFHL